MVTYCFSLGKMPFVILCGLPSSGKSTRAKDLKGYIETRENVAVNIVSDDDLNLDKNVIYADSKQEKGARGQLKSLVQRDINKDTITILDSLNYIKGYRYELYCITKSTVTPHCVVHCDLPADQAWQWNNDRDDCDKYTEDIFDGLVMRFEAPEHKNRWDSPLFIVHPEDSLPCSEICDVLLRKKPPPPNLSTQSQPISSTNYVHELDKVTQSVVQVIMDAQRISAAGDTITVPGASEQVRLTKVLTLAELQRFRRQFISFSKARRTEDTSKIANMFVQFINTSLK